MSLIKQRKKSIFAWVLKISVILFMMVLVGIEDYHIINRVKNKDMEEYTLQRYYPGERTVQSETIHTVFAPVNHSLDAIMFAVAGDGEPVGRLAYTLVDASEKTILESKKVDVQKIYNKEQQRIALDMSSAVLKNGEDYTLTVVFELNAPINITVDSQGIVLIQRYVVDYKNSLYVILLIINLIIVALIAAFLKWGCHNNLFLAISLAVGLMAVLFISPFARDDEFRHFARAYDLATKGEFAEYDVPRETCTGVVSADEAGKIPMVSIPYGLNELRMVDHSRNFTSKAYSSENNVDLCIPKLLTVLVQEDGDERYWVSECGTSGGNLISYWPQVIMISVGRVLGVKSVFLYYMACLGQVIAVALMMRVSLRLSPSIKSIIWFAAFMPPSILLFASSNKDGLMISEIILCLSMILHIRDKEYPLTNWKSLLCWGIYIFTVYNVWVIKMPYAILCLGFMVLLKRKNFSITKMNLTKKQRNIIFSVGIAIVAVALGYIIVVRKSDVIFALIYGFIPQDHFDYWMSNFVPVTNMMLHKGKDLLSQTLQVSSGATMVHYGWMAILVLILSKRRENWLQKGCMLFIFLVMLEVVVLFGYILTPPDYGQIVGVTFRYLLPVLPALGMVLPLGTEKTEDVVQQYFPLVLIPLVMISVVSQCMIFW